VGESTYVGRDLLGTIGDEERDALTEAEAFLRDELAYGPVDVRELKRSAGNAGLSWTTVERAKKKLGIARPGSVKRVGGIAGEGHWTWELPKTVTLRPSREPEADDGLSETPHQQRENGASPTPEVAYDRHAHALTALGERELQEWRNEAARRVLEERDRRQAEKDAVLSFDDVGTAPLADLQRAHEEGRL
jgi:hypothetical protein